MAKKKTQPRVYKEKEREDTIYEDELDLESVESLLRRMKNLDGNPLITDRQIHELLSLTIEDELPLFSLENRSQLYEIIGYFMENPTLINKEIEKMRNVLRDATRSFIPEDILFSMNFFDKEKTELAIEEEASRQTSSVQQGEGLYICGKCGSDKTVYTEKQLRSSDEPMSVIVKCENCGHGWRIG
jgi:DNA-directed RNA polymerase subunit M/transcription elongation factor TFIIS